MSEPYYLPIGTEVEAFTAAWEERLPVLLKGPTGCGKTRFLAHMAHRLRGSVLDELPLVTVSCHDELSVGDLVGRYLLTSSETVWLDGPLTTAVASGGICYLDEAVEARKDTIVVLHSLTDDRRILPIAKRGSTIEAHPDFFLVVSFNPGYQSLLKSLKTSTRQRFVAIDFGYPDVDQEAAIVGHEADLDQDTATSLAVLAAKARNLEGAARIEGPGTRLLVHAGRLIRRGLAPREACEVALVHAISDDLGTQEGLREVVESIFA
jgi:nitric oxide reductase NorQ protein